MRIVSDNHVSKEEFEAVKSLAAAALAETNELKTFYRFASALIKINFVVSLGIIAAIVVEHFIK